MFQIHTLKYLLEKRKKNESSASGEFNLIQNLEIM